jgi:hypothetical protein
MELLKDQQETKLTVPMGDIISYFYRLTAASNFCMTGG